MLLAWKILGKVWSIRQDRPVMWKSHWKWLEWFCKLGGAGSQGITRVGKTVSARYGIYLLALWGKSDFRKETMACDSTSVWQKAALPALTLMPDNSVPPLCRWFFSGCCPSPGAQREWISISLCAGPLRGTASDSRGPPSHSAMMPADFHNQNFWGLSLPGTETQDLGVWCEAVTPWSSGVINHYT